MVIRMVKAAAGGAARAISEWTRSADTQLNAPIEAVVEKWKTIEKEMKMARDSKEHSLKWTPPKDRVFVKTNSPPTKLLALTRKEVLTDKITRNEFDNQKAAEMAYLDAEKEQLEKRIDEIKAIQNQTSDQAIHASRKFDDKHGKNIGDSNKMVEAMQFPNQPIQRQQSVKHSTASQSPVSMVKPSIPQKQSVDSNIYFNQTQSPVGTKQFATKPQPVIPKVTVTNTIATETNKKTSVPNSQLSYPELHSAAVPSYQHKYLPKPLSADTKTRVSSSQVTHYNTPPKLYQHEFSNESRTETGSESYTIDITPMYPSWGSSENPSYYPNKRPKYLPKPAMSDFHIRKKKNCKRPMTDIESGVISIEHRVGMCKLCMNLLRPDE